MNQRVNRVWWRKGINHVNKIPQTIIETDIEGRIEILGIVEDITGNVSGINAFSGVIKLFLEGNSCDVLQDIMKRTNTDKIFISKDAFTISFTGVNYRVILTNSKNSTNYVFNHVTLSELNAIIDSDYPKRN